MREENKITRQEQIERAAYKVLGEYAYAGTSMLKIAKEAKASNETLYKWYGDKQGLFGALVERNARDVKQMLETGLAEKLPALGVLQMIGPKLLAMLAGERAVALNRAAAADPSGELGKAISKSGRDAVAPLIGEVIARAHQDGSIVIDDVGAATALYLNLLVGDLQIRRAIGGEPEPTAEFIEQRASDALIFFQRLMSTGPK